ncbi:MAG: class II glutamine amidotransferase [Nitrososphaerota archaeon]
MCIIAYVKNGEKLTTELTTIFHEHNPDGAGLAYYDDNERKWKVVKGLMSLEEIITKLNELQLLDREVHNDFVIHFRYATTGSIIPELTHPFQFKLLDTNCILFHNGTFKLKGVSKCTSSKKRLASSTVSNTVSNSSVRETQRSNSNKDDKEICQTACSIESDTQRFCNLIEQLRINSEQLKELVKENGLLDTVINNSRLCLLFENEKKPVFIGDWYEYKGLRVSNLRFIRPKYVHTTTSSKTIDYSYSSTFPSSNINNIPSTSTTTVSYFDVEIEPNEVKLDTSLFLETFIDEGRYLYNYGEEVYDGYPVEGLTVSNEDILNFFADKLTEIKDYSFVRPQPYVDVVIHLDRFIPIENIEVTHRERIASHIKSYIEWVYHKNVKVEYFLNSKLIKVRIHNTYLFSFGQINSLTQKIIRYSTIDALTDKLSYTDLSNSLTHDELTLIKTIRKLQDSDISTDYKLPKLAMTFSNKWNEKVRKELENEIIKTFENIPYHFIFYGLKNTRGDRVTLSTAPDAYKCNYRFYGDEIIGDKIIVGLSYYYRTGDKSFIETKDIVTWLQELISKKT